MFSLFGMNTSNSLNAIIATVAVLGFITSIVISICTLKQSKNMYLFNERREVLLALYDFTFYTEPDRTECTDFEENLRKMVFLFKNPGKAFDCCLKLSYYYTYNEQLPDYTQRYKKALLKAGYKTDEVTVENAFIFHCRIEIGKLGRNVVNLRKSIFL